ncbi:hypothetical protein clem_04425 [Legionella clemsonensis]|uniref:Uncharacterized protein n=1 Tax=Legionella clemsonensis TaxID=1867846 RepID=A0A222P0R3_9GAMM|nr:hypothetical protein clem_04425 [Legionella clemsonensis]
MVAITALMRKIIVIANARLKPLVTGGLINLLKKIFFRPIISRFTYHGCD